MQAKRLVERGQKVRWNDTDSGSDALDRHRSDLFRLGFRVPIKSRLRCRQEHLKWEDTFGVRGDRDDRDDASSEPLGCAIGAVVADDDRRPALLASAPRTGSRSTRQISPRRISSARHAL
ncbi:MAG: hypothetical protein NVS3B12_03570 [Acidimicrobiales bacterium]